MFFSKNGKFHGIHKHDFGEYLTLVEGNVYEAESVRAKYEKVLRVKAFEILLARLKVIMFIFAFMLCPIILSVLAVNNKAAHIPIYIELTAYSIWFAFGIFLLKKSLPNLLRRINMLKAKKSILTTTMVSVFEYGRAVASSFFTKTGEIKSDYFKNLTQTQIDEITSALSELEFDITVFQDLSHKSKECNEKPILVDEKIFSDRREFSEHFLNNYFNVNIDKYKKILN